MNHEVVTVLLSCLDRAVAEGLPYNREKIEFAITTLAEGRPLLDGVQRDLRTFLLDVHLDPGDYFTDDERFQANTLLSFLEGGFHPSFDRSSFAIAVPRGVHPDVDILIYHPRDALETLYLEALHKNIGTPEEHRAIERMLWLRPLETEDYRLATTFLERLPHDGVRGEGSQLAQARYLLELLAPGTNPHALVERLKQTGLPSRIRILSPLPGHATPSPQPANWDDLLINLSATIREAAQEGDTERVQKLLGAARNLSEAIQLATKTPRPTRPPTPMPRSAVFTAIKGSAALPETHWEKFDQIAANPLMNAALMPLGVVEHVLASIVMGELSWQESIDEGIDVLGGSVVVGGTLWGTVATWNTLSKWVADKKFGGLMKRVEELTPPRLKAYLVPALFLSAFTFIALRQTQTLPLEEAGEYRWNYLEEMAGGFGVQLATTGVSFFGIRSVLNRLGKAPKGRLSGGGVLAIATGAGMFAQEIYSSWRRKRHRLELRDKTYRDVIGMLEAYPTYPVHLKPKLQTRIDRKLSTLIALDILEFPSVKEAIGFAESREKRLANMVAQGIPEATAIKLVGGWGRMEVLNAEEYALAERWIQKLGKKETTFVLPVSMLPAQKRRILAQWEKDLSDVIQFAVHPIPISFKKNQKGEIEPEQFEDWSFAHTMALLRRYIALRAVSS